MKRSWSFALLFPITLVAQDRPSGDGSVCWRGRPAPRCDWIVLTELGVEYPLATTARRVELQPGVDYTTNAFEPRLTVGAGMLRTVGARSAVGALATGAFGFGERKLLEARYRRFSSSALTNVELSAGAVATRLQPDNVQGYGPTIAIGANVADLVGAHVRLDVVRAGGRTYNSIAAGGHLGQRASVAGGVLLAIGFAILASLYSGFE